jgi:Copper binding proteins, plastocyanin/azurin family
MKFRPVIYTAVVAVAAAVAALAVAAVAPAAQTAVPTLRGSVGPGFTINLTRNGRKVRGLRAGTYRIVVRDRSSAHNFVLEKEHHSGIERELTHVRATGTRTVTMKLTRGTWKYYCEPHRTVMRGFFTVR